LSRGHRRFLLSGDDLGAYGRDLGTDLVALLRELVAVPEDIRIILRDIEPHFFIKMFEDLKPVFLSGKVYSFSAPVQSGSDAVLRRMRRRYSVKDFLGCVRWVNASAPAVKIRTAVMVGFPGETEEEFRQSLALLDRARFAMVDVYTYSKRPHTAAEKMEGQVAALIKAMRRLRLELKVGRTVTLKTLRPLWRRDGVGHAS
jgi:tRNA A37 methylthiotransferase MiaB